MCLFPVCVQFVVSYYYFSVFLCLLFCFPSLIAASSSSSSSSSSTFFVYIVASSSFLIFIFHPFTSLPSPPLLLDRWGSTFSSPSLPLTYCAPYLGERNLTFFSLQWVEALPAGCSRRGFQRWRSGRFCYWRLEVCRRLRVAFRGLIHSFCRVRLIGITSRSHSSTVFADMLMMWVFASLACRWLTGDLQVSLLVPWVGREEVILVIEVVRWSYLILIDEVCVFFSAIFFLVTCDTFGVFVTLLYA